MQYSFCYPETRRILFLKSETYGEQCTLSIEALQGAGQHPLYK